MAGKEVLRRPRLDYALRLPITPPPLPHAQNAVCESLHSGKQRKRVHSGIPEVFCVMHLGAGEAEMVSWSCCISKPINPLRNNQPSQL